MTNSFEQHKCKNVWDIAPSSATHYKKSNGCFYKLLDGSVLVFGKKRKWVLSEQSFDDFMNGDDYQERPQPKPAAKHPTTSTEYLTACAQIQSERAKQYDASGTGERSFEAAAEAFNCVTGKNLRGSDVCLIMEMVKLVRQYSDPTRLHEDSVLDAVSYSSLWAEELTKELRHV